MFTLKISTVNAAFGDGNRYDEIARILREVAARVEGGQQAGSAMDENGNKVGSWRFTG